MQESVWLEKQIKEFWSWHMKEFRVLNESFESSVKPRLLYDILAKTCSWELYSTCFFLLIIIIKVKIQSVSSVLSVPSCWSLTIIIVWENHKQWRLTDCLGVQFFPLYLSFILIYRVKLLLTHIRQYDVIL